MPSATGSVERARARAARSSTASLENGGAASRAATGAEGPFTSSHHSVGSRIVPSVNHSAAAYVGRSTTIPPAEPGSVGKPLAEPVTARKGPCGPSGTRAPTAVPVFARKRSVATAGTDWIGVLRPGVAVNVTEPRLGNVETDPDSTSKEKKPSVLTRTTREGCSAPVIWLALTCHGSCGAPTREKGPALSATSTERMSTETGRLARNDGMTFVSTATSESGW